MGHAHHYSLSPIYASCWNLVGIRFAVVKFLPPSYLELAVAILLLLIWCFLLFYSHLLPLEIPLETPWWTPWDCQNQAIYERDSRVPLYITGPGDFPGNPPGTFPGNPPETFPGDLQTMYNE